ncbi:hypothetical protein AF335_26400 [Streptomyces eurocidicus]|uniref:DUF1453 domain-containing protein n=1 Tax=Streptomyces eurocidicus TaxID=66423 RepID=A0A2N8NQ59_STREU|nr:DUF1453 domain-containing protein [Streptomyces eurocidicus]MBB5122330.1 hypothetical protein [Streptomyces eurocidicus]MBF6051615.1 DUF1453 domain-containing protein [Streptomyces eurocidicus]PNE30890.1 hypothetical protein AF335_26400 [Streptomyces eurocidicus]
MNGWVPAAAIVVVLIVVVVRRLRGEPLNARDLLVAPLVLTGIGVMSVIKADDVTGADLGWLIPGAALGVARGATIEVFERGGVLWQRYTGKSFAVAAGSLVLMAGFGYVAARSGMHASARPTQLNIGVGFLGEALVVAVRGLASGIPFAPERGRR